VQIEAKLSRDDTVLTIFIEGDFNFSLLQQFRGAYNTSAASAAKKIIVDLRKTLTVDSTALGMLLSMQKELSVEDKAISIINCNAVVRKIFGITNFDKKFTIE
jgi:anti-anti-sigma factor